ncbi:hypothetical protein MOQ_010002 [Trypanosoma cruzi marinkellei]|uniref:Uncharacterized protein n=1 Tax=Trypanosoma cruzi marinkellei TaxID=85056 RepID=K2LU95_TRYCR|nr:hypothetical protein MOQ_010002 [Trypanosoma cruzi marinkellei]
MTTTTVLALPLPPSSHHHPTRTSSWRFLLCCVLVGSGCTCGFTKQRRCCNRLQTPNGCVHGSHRRNFIRAIHLPLPPSSPIVNSLFFFSLLVKGVGVYFHYTRPWTAWGGEATEPTRWEHCDKTTEVLLKYIYIFIVWMCGGFTVVSFSFSFSLSFFFPFSFLCFVPAHISCRKRRRHTLVSHKRDVGALRKKKGKGEGGVQKILICVIRLDEVFALPLSWCEGSYKEPTKIPCPLFATCAPVLFLSLPAHSTADSTCDHP